MARVKVDVPPLVVMVFGLKVLLKDNGEEITAKRTAEEKSLL